MLQLSVSERKNFEVFIPCSYVQTCDPWGQGKFSAKGHHMNKLGRGALGNATYQISELHAFQFQRGRILKFVFFVSMSTTPTPNMKALALRVSDKRIFKNFLLNLYVESETQQHRIHFHSRSII